MMFNYNHSQTGIMIGCIYLVRKQCVNCGCPRHFHRILNQHCDLPYLKKCTLNEDIPAGDKRRLDLKYDWYPSGIDYETVSSIVYNTL